MANYPRHERYGGAFVHRQSRETRRLVVSGTLSIPASTRIGIISAIRFRTSSVGAPDRSRITRLYAVEA